MLPPLIAPPVPDVTFGGVAMVAGVAFAVPALLRLIPSVPIPSAVVEILVGILIGPAVLGWVQVDIPIYVLSLIGLGVLLFVGGLEIDIAAMRGPLLRLSALGFLASLCLGLMVAFGLHSADLVRDPFLIALILASTSLGVLVPILEDARQIGEPFGQLVLAAASFGEVIPVLLLSVLFSDSGGSGQRRLLLLLLFSLVTFVILAAMVRASRVSAFSRMFLELQDTSAQLRIRGMFLLLSAFGAIALRFGLEGILGAFIAGLLVRLADRDGRVVNTQERVKVAAIANGVFIPVFWVTTGLEFDLRELFASTDALLRVPILLVALLFVRGLPALLYRRMLGMRQALAAGLFQATSLSFIVVAARLGLGLGVMLPATSAALIATALLSALIFPLAGLTVLGGAPAAKQVPSVGDD